MSGIGHRRPVFGHSGHRHLASRWSPTTPSTSSRAPKRPVEASVGDCGNIDARIAMRRCSFTLNAVYLLSSNWMPFFPSLSTISGLALAYRSRVSSVGLWPILDKSRIRTTLCRQIKHHFLSKNVAAWRIQRVLSERLDLVLLRHKGYWALNFRVRTQVRRARLRAGLGG
jgi:hypothetical protein